MSISVLPVNDRPTFVLLWDEMTILEGSAAFSQPVIAQSISRGSSFEDLHGKQQWTFKVDVVSQDPVVGGQSIFSQMPALSANGTLTFGLISEAYGNVTLQFTLKDDGGTERGGDDTSTAQVVVIVAVPVNQPPSFDLSTFYLPTTEDSGKNTFPNVAVNISRGNWFEDSLQNFSFLVQPSQTDFPVVHSVHMLSDGSLHFETRLDAAGNSSFNVTLIDDGQDGGNGLCGVHCSETTGFKASSVRAILIEVRAVNDKPEFRLILNEIQLLEEFEFNPIVRHKSIADDIKSGPQDESEQHVSFSIHPTQAHVPAVGITSFDSSFDSRSNLGALYSDGAEGQLFAPSTLVNMSTNGTLFILLAKFRHGSVNFTISLVDDGGTANDGMNTSDAKSFLLHVIPVNSRPTFDIPKTILNLNETHDRVVHHEPKALFNVSPGGWKEHDQLLSFKIMQISGVRGLGFLAVSCSEQQMEDEVGCSPGTVGLEFESVENRFGEAQFSIQLMDDGGSEDGGKNSTTHQISVRIRPRNNAPSFRLAAATLQIYEDSSCFVDTHQDQNFDGLVDVNSCDLQSSTRQHTLVHFARAISFGPFEDGMVDCHPFACDSDGTECIGENLKTGCESQKGTFLVVPANEDQAHAVFTNLPLISIDGTLVFEVAELAHGVVAFNVTLMDSGGLGEFKQFLISVLNVKPPTFDFLQDLPPLYEGGGFTTIPHFIMIENVTDSVEERSTFTFHVSIPNEHERSMFSPEHLPSVNSAGDLSFSLSDHAFGSANLNVELEEEGVVRIPGASMTIRNATILVCPYNDPPTFVLKHRVDVLENTGSQIFAQAASSIKSGPYTERCQQESTFCQKQLVSLFVTDISNPSLFAAAPMLSSEGDLFFTAASDASGVSMFYVYAIDDGKRFVPDLCQYRGVDTSETESMLIVVQPINDPPSFALPWQVSCRTVKNVGECRCDLSAGGDFCKSREGNFSSVSVLQSAGLFRIGNFVTHISPADGFESGSVSFFEPLPTMNDCDNNDNGLDCVENPHLVFAGPLRDPVMSSASLEYSVATARFPEDQPKHIYSVDMETDTLSAFEMRNGPETIKIVDRRGDGERRLRFTGFAPYPSLNSLPKQVTAAAAVCHWNSFNVAGRYFASSASGCLDLQEYIENEANTCENELQMSVPCEIIIQTVNTAIGHWDFDFDSTRGLMTVNGFGGDNNITCSSESCAFSRPQRKDVECFESYPVLISRATIRDKSNVFGAAVLTGPVCKMNLTSDWDRTQEESLSMSTFLMNNGLMEALQFDGVLNTGLLVADDLAVVAHKLPRYMMSVEVWFAVTSSHVPFGGLISLLQESDTCSRGWGIGYAHVRGKVSSLQFNIALAGRAHNSLLKLSASVSFELGTWLHLVATYDGHHAKLYADSVLLASDQACANPPCGQILYPVRDEFKQCSTPTKFHIGTYSAASGQDHVHFGAIKTVRIFDRPLVHPEIKNLFRIYAQKLKASPIINTEYWVKQTSRLQRPHTSLSPDTTHSLASDATSVVTIRGQFRDNITYRCLFLHRNMRAFSANFTFPCDGANCDQLICSIPYWKYGFRAATLAVERQDPNSGIWRAMWQRVCMTASCGFSPVHQRHHMSSNKWWTFGNNRLLHPGLDGAKSIHTFRLESYLFEFNQFDEELHLKSSFSKNATTAGDGSSFLDASDISGASSLMHFESASQHYLVASNFWDGAQALTPSVIFKLSFDDIDAEKIAMPVQSILTRGAREFQHLSLHGCEFLAVASFLDGLQIYHWNSSVDESNVMDVGRSKGASAVKKFSAGNKLYLVVPRYFDSGLYSIDSHIYEVKGKDDQSCGIVLEEAQNISTSAAQNVEYMTIDKAHYLAFASNSLNDAVNIFVWEDEFEGSPDFKFLQSLPTRKVSSLHHLSISPHFLVVSQMEDDMMLFRWNGSMFLGPIDLQTIHKDSAGGQRFSNVTACSSTSIQVKESNQTYLIASIKNLDPTSSRSLLWREQSEVLPHFLNGPTSVVVSPDGKFVYVSSLYSRAIAGFYRNNLTGHLVHCPQASSIGPWVHANDSAIRMIQRMVMSPDGSKIYATAYLDNSVVTFGRDPNDGSLDLSDILSDGMSQGSPVKFIDGLVGAYTLSLSLSGHNLFVGSLQDKAVVLFELNQTGKLEYVDCIKEGERIFNSFQSATDDATWEIPSYLYKSEEYEKLWSRTPFRLGGNAIDRPWTFTAQDIVSFTIDDALFLVVAASDVDLYSDGRVSIYKSKGNYNDLSFSVWQELTSENGATAVVYFSRKLGQSTGHFIVVANGLKMRKLTSSINVYQWNPTSNRFVFDHYLQAPGGQKCFASSLDYFTLDTKDTRDTETGFLAVGCLWDGETTRVSSMVFSWDSEGQRISDHTAFFGEGFKWYQDLNGTMAVSDVTFYRFNGLLSPSGRPSGLLIFANSQGPFQSDIGNNSIGIFEFNSSSQEFERMQSIDCVGAADVEAFTIPGEGEFLAIASRQRKFSNAHDQPQWDVQLSVYDEESTIWKWDAMTRRFNVYQLLGRSFTTISESGEHQVEGLRGITGFKMFSSKGEFYLAVAQSVCDTLPAVGRQECLRYREQPKSAILQWNRVDRKFGELLSMTDFDNLELRGQRVQYKDIDIHHFAMRLSVGRARRWHFLPITDEKQLLICLSLTKGVVVYSWEFSQVVGLGGLQDLTTDLNDEFVYAVAREDRALLTFKMGLLHDHVNRSSCIAERCLLYVSTRSEKVSRCSNCDQFTPGLTTGLKGAVSIAFARDFPGFSRGAVVVRSGMPRDELQCGCVGPDAINNSGDFGLSAACQNVHFNVSAISSSSDGLFVIPPHFDHHGTLIFETNSQEFGEAWFLVSAVDSNPSNSSKHAQSMTPSQYFRIQVTQTQKPPTFVLTQGLEVGEGLEAIVEFAQNASTGSRESADKNLSWSVVHDCQLIFKSEPELSFVSPSSFYGLTGIMNVSLRDFQPGTCKLNVTLKGENSSTTRTLDFASVKRNRGPQFEHLDLVEIEHSDQVKIIPDFLHLISSGSWYEANQRVSFQVANVTDTDGSSLELFTYVRLDTNGTLSFLEGPGGFGEYVVTLKATDDGGTENSGVNTSFSSFRLKLFKGNFYDTEIRPLVVSPGRLQVLESRSEVTEQIFKNFFEAKNVQDKTNATVAKSFVIENVSNPALFHGLPSVDANGSLLFTLQPHRIGFSNLTVTLMIHNRVCACNSSLHVLASPRSEECSCSASGADSSLPHIVTVSVHASNRPPSFSVPNFFGTVENAGEVFMNGFATHILPGSGNEEGQRVRFQTKVSGVTNGFFILLPEISPSGDLRFEVSQGRHGLAVVEVRAIDDGASTGMDVNASSESAAVVIKVLPRPVVLDVVPRMGPVAGGDVITIVGSYFGSTYSRGFHSSTYENLSVFIGPSKCINTTFISDTTISCITPPGVGQSLVTVNISDGGLTRSGLLQQGYAHNLLYAGGSMMFPRSAGFVAQSPFHTSSGLSGDFPLSLGSMGLLASKTIRALNIFQGLMYIGGDFTSLNNVDKRYVFGWDGSKVSKLENGLDGSVFCLLTFKNKLVVAGAFTHVHKRWDSVKTGGLALWDGQQWGEEGAGAEVDGVVTSMATNGTLLYIAGRFKNIGGLHTDGLAMWDGTVWSAIYSDQLSGEITAISVSTSILYLAGTFRSLKYPDEEKSQLVRWDGMDSGWLSLGTVQGRINSILVHAESIYVGGDFNVAGKSDIANLALFKYGRWSSLGGMFNGAVNALLLCNNCVYVGGAFTAIRTPPFLDSEEMPALFGARYCNAMSLGRASRFEGLEPMPGMGPIHTMISAESSPGLAVSDSRVFLELVDDGCSGCNGHGACEAGHCVCDPHWSGNDCSENVGFAASG